MMNDRKSKPIKIGQILDNLLADNRQRQKSPQSVIMDNWKSIVGADNSLDSGPLMIKNKVLLIFVSNSSLLHYFSLKKNDILNKIHGFVDKEVVNDIRFRIGKNT